MTRLYGIVFGSFCPGSCILPENDDMQKLYYVINFGGDIGLVHLILYFCVAMPAEVFVEKGKYLSRE